MIEIPLTKGKVALVDDEDYELVSQYKWCALEVDCGLYYYAVHGFKKTSLEPMLLMHKFLMSPPEGHVVHHRDNIGTNNQRSNLVILTHSQHNATKRTSNKYKGVRYQFPNCRWEAHIKYQGVFMSLGYFDTAEEAALERDKAAKRLYGEEVYLNFGNEE